MTFVGHCIYCNKGINNTFYDGSFFIFEIDCPNSFPYLPNLLFPMTYLQVAYENGKRTDDIPSRIYYCSRECFEYGEGYIDKVKNDLSKNILTLEATLSREESGTKRRRVF